MNIIIAGAGAVGYHLAELLSKENQNITLIDNNEAVLDRVINDLDVLTIHGDAASIDILEQANIKKANLFLAVTTSEKTNLLTAILAKQLGAKRTIARIINVENLTDNNKAKYEQLGVDMLISPQNLAAMEVERLLRRASFTDLFEFENGKLSVVGFTLDAACPLNYKTIGEIDELNDDFIFRGIALLRGHETLIPRRDTRLQRGDHLYISTRARKLENAMTFMGKQLKPIKSIMIIGGTQLALLTAQKLEQKYSVKIVIKDEDLAKYFLDRLHNTLIINADPSDVTELKDEGLERMDAFIALTPNSETNIITSLMAEDLGVYKTIALVENVNYTHISQNIGIDTIINQKLLAANSIFRFVRKGKIEAIASLHGVDAEIIEFELHKSNRLLDKTIKQLRLPPSSIVAGVVRGNESFIPDDEFVLAKNDKIVVLALPDAIKQVEEIFK
jgi:trk system potassium uptake protein TrkA